MHHSPQIFVKITKEFKIFGDCNALDRLTQLLVLFHNSPSVMFITKT